MAGKRSHAGALLASLLLLAAPISCGGDQDDEQSAARKADQAAIEKYSQATPKLAKELDTFVKLWNDAFVSGEVSPVVDAVNDKTMTALSDLIAALKQMPTETKELESIHKQLVSEYENTASALSAFAKTLSDSNRKEPVDALTKQLHALAQAENTYQEKLKAYYAECGVQLADSAASSQGAPAAGAAPSGP